MSDYVKNADIALDWDDTLENDGQDYVILPEGDYNFEVIGFERGTFNGSAKMNACNKAILTLQVVTDDGIANIRTDLIMNRIMEWRISAFFRCIGQKKHGEKLKMDWNKVVGSKGRAHFKPRTYVGTDNQEHQVNDVVRFFDYEEKFTEVNGDDDLPFD